MTTTDLARYQFLRQQEEAGRIPTRVQRYDATARRLRTVEAS